MTAEQASISLAEQRRATIIATAVVFFAERGYYQTTIEDISKKIGISKGLVYRYFKDKNDVLFSALCLVFEKYNDEKVVKLLERRGPLAALRKVLAANCALADQHIQETILAYRSTNDLRSEQNHLIQTIESRMIAEIRQCLETCVQKGLMHPVNVKFVSYQYLMFGHTWALKRSALSHEFSAKEYLTEGENTLIVPFLTARGYKEILGLRASESSELARAPRVRPTRKR